MFKKREIISVFDIEGDLVKLAQIGIEDGRRSLYRLATQKVQEKGPNGLVKAIRKLISDHRVIGTRVIVNLPRHKVTVKNLKLPSINPAEVESMVRLQAAKQLPFSPEKIISGCRILGKDKEGYSEVMMVLAHRDVIDNILKGLKQAGLDIERLALSSEGLSLWYVDRQKENEKRSCVCLVDIGRSVLEIMIIKEGGIDFSRSISFSSASDMAEKMEDEIKKTLFTYKKTSAGQEVQKLVLTGRRSALGMEAPLLKKNLRLPTVYIDALKQSPKAGGVVLPGDKEIQTESFVSSLSLGFYYDKLETNLIPHEIRLKRVSKIAKESLVISAALFISVALGIGGILAKSYTDKMRFLSSINRNLSETKPKVEKLTRLKEVTHVVKKQLDITGSSIDIVRELYGKIPSDISLTIFDYEDGRSLLLRGVSQRLSDVFKFISILEDSSYFENVKVRYATKRVIGKKELTDFEIICQLTRM